MLIYLLIHATTFQKKSDSPIEIAQNIASIGSERRLSECCQDTAWSPATLMLHELRIIGESERQVDPEPPDNLISKQIIIIMSQKTFVFCFVKPSKAVKIYCHGYMAQTIQTLSNQ